MFDLGLNGQQMCFDKLKLDGCSILYSYCDRMDASAWMIGVLWTCMEAEHGVTMDDMYDVKVRFQNTSRCDTRGEKHTSSTTATNRSHKRREYFVGLFTLSLHDEGDFECDTGMDGKPVSCFSVGVMWPLGLRPFIILATVCGTENKGCSMLLFG